MKNKKAMTLKTVLGLIIGILCVVILIMLAVGLYNLFIKPGVQEQAKETLKQIVNEINGLNEGSESSYLVLNPEEWSLISYEKKLYLCDINSVGISSKGGEKQKAIQICDNAHIFYELDNEIEIHHDCLFKTIDNCFLLKELPREIVLRKENNKIIISTKEQLIGETNFANILELKGESSKTIKELILEYVYGEKKSLRIEIRQILENYFNGFDSEGITGIKKGNFMWQFYLSKEIDVNGAPVDMSIFSESSDSGVVYSGETFSWSDYEFSDNGVKYKIVVRYYDKSKVIVGGTMNM